MKIHWTYWNISKLGWETKFSHIFSKHNKITLPLLTKKTLIHELPRARNIESQLYLQLCSFEHINTKTFKQTSILRYISNSLNHYRNPTGLADCDCAKQDTIFSPTNSSSLKRLLSSHHTFFF